MESILEVRVESSTRDARLALTHLVAASGYFSRSPKLRAFLLYVCENAIAGNPENVREQLIGSRVFGRASQYNSGEDNIVRVEARELRKRLQAYFAAEGRDEPIVIEIPKGSYVPVFSSRTFEPATPLRVPVPQTIAALPTRRPPFVPALSAALLLALFSILWLGIQNRRLHEQKLNSTALSSSHPGPDYAFYGDLLGSLGTLSNREALLVLSNPRVVVYFGSHSKEQQGLLDQMVVAPKGLKRNFGYALSNGDRDSSFQFLRFTRNDYTGMGEAVAAFQIGGLMEVLHRPIRLTQSRFLNWDHVAKQDLIVLGGPASNDWTYQNGAQSTFNFELTGVEDRDPRPGETGHYIRHADSDEGSGTEYGVIKMLLSPFGFRTLLLAGTTSTGTAGVSQFFADPVRMKEIHDAMRRASPGQPLPAEWEVLLKITERDGTPVQTSAVAFRPAPKR